MGRIARWLSRFMRRPELNEAELSGLLHVMHRHLAGDPIIRADVSKRSIVTPLAIAFNRVIESHNDSMRKLYTHTHELYESNARVEDQASELLLRADALQSTCAQALAVNAAQVRTLTNVRKRLESLADHVELLLDGAESWEPHRRQALVRMFQDAEQLLAAISDAPTTIRSESLVGAKT